MGFGKLLGKIASSVSRVYSLFTAADGRAEEEELEELGVKNQSTLKTYVQAYDSIDEINKSFEEVNSNYDKFDKDDINRHSLVSGRVRKMRESMNLRRTNNFAANLEENIKAYERNVWDHSFYRDEAGKEMRPGVEKGILLHSINYWSGKLANSLIKTKELDHEVRNNYLKLIEDSKKYAKESLVA